MTHTNDDFISNFFSGFKAIETKESITKDYIEGKITKDEFIRRMKEIDNV